MNDTEYDRSQPLDRADAKKIRKLLPAGYDLVEGDFADDEKWRIVNTTPDDPSHVAAHPETPKIADCACGCGSAIHEHEPRIQDARGVWIDEHYTA